MSERSPPGLGDPNKLRKGKDASLVAELYRYVRRTRKWWVLPTLTVLMLVGLLLLLSSTVAAPFIYTLF